MTTKSAGTTTTEAITTKTTNWLNWGGGLSTPFFQGRGVKLVFQFWLPAKTLLKL